MKKMEEETEKRIKRILEKENFVTSGDVEKQGEKYYLEFGQRTPEGEDWTEIIWFNGSIESFANVLEQRALTFDIDDEVEPYISCRGKYGCPSSISDLIADTEWKKETLLSLSQVFNEAVYCAESNDNMPVTQDTITQDQIEEVNIYLEYEEGSRVVSNLGYSFYYNLMQQNMHPADADRYANLNTILGYDVGKDIFTSIDSYVWEHNYDLLELSGSEADKKVLEEAAEKLQISLDFSKWKDLSGQQYDYLFFEEEGSSGSENFEKDSCAVSKTPTFAWKYDIHNQSGFDKVITDIGKNNSILDFITVARLICPNETGAALMVQLEVPTSKMLLTIKKNLPLLNQNEANGLWLAAYTLIDNSGYDNTIPVSCMNYYRKITYENAEELMLKYAKLIYEN